MSECNEKQRKNTPWHKADDRRRPAAKARHCKRTRTQSQPHPKSRYQQSTDACTASLFLSILCQNSWCQGSNVLVLGRKPSEAIFVSCLSARRVRGSAILCYHKCWHRISPRALIRAHVRSRRHFAKLPHPNSRTQGLLRVLVMLIRTDLPALRDGPGPLSAGYGRVLLRCWKGVHCMFERCVTLKGALSRAALGTRFCRFGGEIYVLSSFFIVLDLVNPWPSDYETSAETFLFTWASWRYVFFKFFFEFRKNVLGDGQVPTSVAFPLSASSPNRWLWEHSEVRGPPPEPGAEEAGWLSCFCWSSSHLNSFAKRSLPSGHPFFLSRGRSVCGPVAVDRSRWWFTYCPLPTS